MGMSVRRSLAAAAAVLALAAGGCSDGGTNPQTEPDVVEIHLTSNFQFSPADVTITPGTTVRWINDAAVAHTITPDNPAQAGVWAAQNVAAAGAAFQHTFNATGTFSYHCIPHQPGMDGVIRVQ